MKVEFRCDGWRTLADNYDDLSWELRGMLPRIQSESATESEDPDCLLVGRIRSMPPMKCSDGDSFNSQ